MKTLLFLLASLPALYGAPLSPAETNTLLDGLARKHSGGAFESDFREEKQMALLKKPVIESGTVAFLPPDKFRREVPGKSLTVCDGKVLWLFYPEFKEAEKYTLSSNRALRESISAMTSGFGLQNIAKNYEIKAEKLKDGYSLDLIPKSAALRKSVKEIKIDINPSLAVERLEIQGAEGDRTVTTFSNERRASLATSDFQFQVPDGVTVSEPMK